MASNPFYTSAPRVVTCRGEINKSQRSPADHFEGVAAQVPVIA